MEQREREVIAPASIPQELFINSDADIAIFDLETENEIEDNFASKSNNTPFIGEKVKGETLYTLVNGKLVWHKGE